MIEKEAGNYIIDRKISEGGFALVYVAIHKYIGRQVIMKILPKMTTSLQSFEHEVNLLKRINHPFIVSLYEYFQDMNFYYIAMEYIEGTNLLDHVNDRGKIDGWQVCHILCQLLMALDYLHNHLYIAHRDIKLENILLDKNGNVRLIDFGLSKSYSNPDDLMTTTCGSSMYIPPEIINGEAYTNKSDMWGLGCVIYSLLMGKSPFYDSNLKKQYLNIKYLDPDYSSFIEPILISITKGLLCKDSSMRLDVKQCFSISYIRDFIQTSLLPSRYYIKYQWDNIINSIPENQNIVYIAKKLGISLESNIKDMLNDKYSPENAILRILIHSDIYSISDTLLLYRKYERFRPLSLNIIVHRRNEEKNDTTSPTRSIIQPRRKSLFSKKVTFQKR